VRAKIKFVVDAFSQRLIFDFEGAVDDEKNDRVKSCNDLKGEWGSVSHWATKEACRKGGVGHTFVN
jgi:hypothetical protein